MRRTKVKGMAVDPLEAAIERELVRRDQRLSESFYDFVLAAWDQVEPYPFKDGMHIRAICDHLQAAAERRIKRLCINIAPRQGKSVLVSVLFPAWVLARSPKEALLYASYSATLANRDSVKTRALVESDWYRARFPHVEIREDANLKTSFQTTAGGGRQATSVGGTVTGLGGSFLVLDDPLNASDGDSEAVRETANQWFQESWMNRLAGDPDQAVRIVVMQRLHARDISAVCHDQGWDMLVLPMEYEGSSKPTSIGWTDPRTEFGQLLWPEQWPAETLVDFKKQSYVWAGQYQQRPVPRSGGIIKARWLRYWYDPNLVVAPDPVFAHAEDGSLVECPQVEFTPSTSLPVAASWDCSFKGGTRSDFVVGQVWYRDRASYYLLDQTRDHLDMPQTCAALRAQHAKWAPLPTLVEGAANGPAVVQSLQHEIDGIKEVRPEGGKESRCAAVAPLFEAGNIYVPHPAMYAWVGAYVAEVTTFPRGTANDDQVDSTTQALVHLRERRVAAVDIGEDFGGVFHARETESLVQDTYWVN